MTVNYEDYSNLFSNYKWSIYEEEKPSWDYLRSYLKSGCVFFDIGCQRGIYTKGVLDLLNENCEIHSFDVLAHPIMVNINKKNKNVIFNNTAVGNGKKHECVIDFNTNTKVKSTTISLDEYVVEKNIKNIDFIKIDVDGLQNVIIDGSDYILKNMSPILMIEMNSNFGYSVLDPKEYFDNNSDKNDLELFKKLKSYSYDAYAVRNGSNVFYIKDEKLA